MARSCPHLDWRAFGCPKEGHSWEEIEDAFAADPGAGRFAVADGVAESAFAGTWAKLLTEIFVRSRDQLSIWLPSAQQAWQVQCQRPHMPWYVEEKFVEGAHATFIGLCFRGPRTWHASAVGDCCLFHVREGGLRQAFPVRQSQDFGSCPPSLRSRSNGDEKGTKYLHLWGRWHQGDLILLATDALGEWFLRQFEERREPWNECRQIKTQQQFAGWVRQRREAKEIRNDDTTLMVIESAPI
jgi:hypothetical protein